MNALNAIICYNKSVAILQGPPSLKSYGGTSRRVIEQVNILDYQAEKKPGVSADKLYTLRGRNNQNSEFEIASKAQSK